MPTAREYFEKKVGAETTNQVVNSLRPLTAAEIRNAVQKIFKGAGMREVKMGLRNAEAHGQIRKKVVGGKTYYEVNPEHIPPEPTQLESIRS